MEANRNTEFDKLFYKVVTNQCSLEYLEEIRLFYPKYIGTANFGKIKSDCDSLRSMMYFVNGLFDQSLEIDLDLLKTNSDADPSYYTLVVSATKTSEELGRTDEVVAYAVRFLKNQDDHFYAKLPVLAWYVDHYPNGEEGSFTEFEQTFSTIVESMGVKVDPSLYFIDRVEYVYGEFLRCTKDLHTFQLVHGKAPLEQKDKIVNDYLEIETVGFFRAYVIKHFQK